MLGEREVREIGEGVEWGSHSSSHAYLDRVPPNDLEEELRRSKSEIEEMTKKPVRYLAYPDSRSNASVSSAAQRAGYAAAFRVDQAAATRLSPRFDLPRFDVTVHPRGMMALEITGVIQLARKLRTS
jgi:peptidoglycan/xylan/chitin deacetylase (PgdA/CDA1 family)